MRRGSGAAQTQGPFRFRAFAFPVLAGLVVVACDTGELLVASGEESPDVAVESLEIVDHRAGDDGVIVLRDGQWLTARIEVINRGAVLAEGVVGVVCPGPCDPAAAESRRELGRLDAAASRAVDLELQWPVDVLGPGELWAVVTSEEDPAGEDSGNNQRALSVLVEASPAVITGMGALVPGEIVVVTGDRLDRIATLVVDGVEVEMPTSSRTEATFEMPTVRTCDIDGRPVPVLVNGELQKTGRLDVRPLDPLELDVGETRVIEADALPCMQLPSAPDTAVHILSIGNFSTKRVEEHVLRLSSVVPDGVSAARSAALRSGTGWSCDPGQVELASTVAAHRAAGFVEAMRDVLAATVPFDDYAGAEVGDTVRMVDWWTEGGVYRYEVKEDVPFYEAHVLVATPGTLVVVDTRLEAEVFGALLSAETRAEFERGVEMTETYALPALRAVMHPDIAVPGGAGGRVVHVVQKLSGIAGTVISSDISPGRNWASGMYTTRLSSNFDQYSAHRIASVMIHEIAHLADHAHRLWGVAPSSSGWYMEALAVQVSEMASRVAAGSERQVPAGRADDGTIPFSRIARAPSSSAFRYSPYGPAGSTIGATGLGSYDRGARLLSFADQLVSDGGFSPPVPTLYQRLQEDAKDLSNGTFEELVYSWGIQRVAEVTGIETEELLRVSMLADLTDDLLDPAAAAAHGLYPLENWDHSVDMRRHLNLMGALGRAIRPGQAFDEDLTVPAGGYAYWYIPTDERGVSLQASDISLQPHHEVGITRLR